MSIRLFITAASLLLSSLAFAQSEEPNALTSETQSEEMVLSSEQQQAMDADADGLATPDDLEIRLGFGWPNKKFACYARSGNGRWFRATAHNPREAQWEAMRICQWNARHCYAMGCERIR